MHRLTRKEQTNVEQLAQKLNLSSERFIVSKKIYNSYEKDFKSDPLLYKIYKDIQNKLDYTPLIPTIPTNTKELHQIYKAAIYDNNNEQKAIPIQLISQHSNYSLWRILQAPSQELHTKINGTVVVHLDHILALRFPLYIEEVIHSSTETLIKIAHTSAITLLTRRKNPRIDINEEGFIKKEGKLSQNPFYKCKIENISKGGIKVFMKLSMDFNPFEENDRVEINTKLDYKKIHLIGTIYKKFPNNCYSVRFNNIDKHTQSIIERFVHKYS